jgi:hypothetical protein
MVKVTLTNRVKTSSVEKDPFLKKNHCIGYKCKLYAY